MLSNRAGYALKIGSDDCINTTVTAQSRRKFRRSNFVDFTIPFTQTEADVSLAQNYFVRVRIDLH